MLHHFKDSDFDSEVTKYNGLVLVDFWAPWCGPCRMLGPVIEELADEVDSSVKVGKVNVDEEGLVASKYGIMSIPAVFLFKNGEVVERLIGLQEKSEYMDAVKRNM